MGRFVDQTGRPGPSTWEAGGYAEGHGDDPVTGVSWYEAAVEFRSCRTGRWIGWPPSEIPASGCTMYPELEVLRGDPRLTGFRKALRLTGGETR